jgi:hypothetical protein
MKDAEITQGSSSSNGIPPASQAQGPKEILQALDFTLIAFTPALAEDKR